MKTDIRTSRYFDHKRLVKEKRTAQMLELKDFKLPKEKSLKYISLKVQGAIKGQKVGFAPSTEEEREKAALMGQKSSMQSDALSRSQNYRNFLDELQNCQLMTSLFIIRQPIAARKDDADLNASSTTKQSGVVRFQPKFETNHLLLRPHSKGFGQQSGYKAVGSGNIAHEYVGLFTTLSHLQKWKEKA